MKCDICGNKNEKIMNAYGPYIVDLSVPWIDGDDKGHYKFFAHLCSFECLGKWIDETKKELGYDA